MTLLAIAYKKMRSLSESQPAALYTLRERHSQAQVIVLDKDRSDTIPTESMSIFCIVVVSATIQAKDVPVDPRTRSQSLACLEHCNDFGTAFAERVPVLGIPNIVQYLHSSHVCFC
jgi:hypothetical protein